MVIGSYVTLWLLSLLTAAVFIDFFPFGGVGTAVSLSEIGQKKMIHVFNGCKTCCELPKKAYDQCDCESICEAPRSLIGGV